MKIGKALCAGLILWPGVSLAHGMGNSVGYRLALESMGDSLNSPIVLLLLAGFALLAGTSGVERARIACVFFAVGLVAGIPASGALGPYGALAGLVVGGLCSLMSAASIAAVQRVMLPAMGLAAGLAGSIYNLDGHPLETLPFAVHLGVVLGPMFVALALAGWIAIVLQANQQPWVRIMFRIFSSWSFAANAIYLAFQLKSGG